MSVYQVHLEFKTDVSLMLQSSGAHFVTQLASLLSSAQHNRGVSVPAAMEAGMLPHMDDKEAPRFTTTKLGDSPAN